MAVDVELVRDGRNVGHGVDDAARMLGCNAQVVYNWQHKIRGLARDFLAAQGA